MKNEFEFVGKSQVQFLNRQVLGFRGPTFLRRAAPHHPVDLSLSTRCSAMKEGVSVGGARQALTGK